MNGRLIGSVAARLNVLLTTRNAEALGPWIVSDWASGVRSALDGLPDSSHEHAQLAVLLAHVHALRGEHVAAAASLQEAIDDSSRMWPRWR